MKQSPRISAPSIAIGLTLAVLLFLFFFCAPSGPNRSVARKARASGEVHMASAALKAYFTEYSEGLTGTNAQVMTVLRGQNPRKIVFFDSAARDFNSQGEFIDPWGTPLRFDLSKPETPRVWSCGPNRKDDDGAEGSDDIASWR